MGDWKSDYASYWFEGWDENTNLVYKTFAELPADRKRMYLRFVAKVKALQMLRKPLMELGKVDLADIPFLHLPKDPKPIELKHFGPTREDREQAGLDGEHFLTRAQADEFCEKGVIGPFRVMSEEDATKLYQDMKASDIPDEETAHLQEPRIAELFQTPALTAKVASLLGENLKLWRGQIF